MATVTIATPSLFLSSVASPTLSPPSPSRSWTTCRRLGSGRGLSGADSGTTSVRLGVGWSNGARGWIDVGPFSVHLGGGGGGSGRGSTRGRFGGDSGATQGRLGGDSGATRGRGGHMVGSVLGRLWRWFGRGSGRLGGGSRWSWARLEVGLGPIRGCLGRCSGAIRGWFWVGSGSMWEKGLKPIWGRFVGRFVAHFGAAEGRSAPGFSREVSGPREGRPRRRGLAGLGLALALAAPPLAPLAGVAARVAVDVALAAAQGGAVAGAQGGAVAVAVAPAGARPRLGRGACAAKAPRPGSRECIHPVCIY